MKELSTKEKAEAYDLALERAKKWYNAPNIDKMPTYGNRIIEEIFPELKELEDEKIRKSIIRCVKGNMPDNDFRKKYIAWLEKQGKKEQDARYKDLEELLAADDIYQMAMNEAMVEEAKSKAINALSELKISELLGLNVEYVHKDAFIEKAVSYIQQHWIWNTIMIKDFKKYMKGE